MSDTLRTTLQYIFVLSLVLVVVVYWAGTQKVLETIFSKVNTIILTSTGRKASGEFANYPV